MNAGRRRGRSLISIAAAGGVALLLALGVLLVNFVALAAELNVNDQTAAAANSASLAVGEVLRDDLNLARTASGVDGLTAAIAGHAGQTTGILLVGTYLDLLSANPRVTAFYFFRGDAGYVFGQSIDPVTHVPMSEEQPPGWYAAENTMRATLRRVLRQRGRAPRLVLSFGQDGDPFGTLSIFQPIVAPAGGPVLGALVEQVTGDSIFAPYLHGAGSNGALFVAGNVLLGPNMARYRALGQVRVLAVDASLDDSITGGLIQTPVGFNLRGAHPRFTLHGSQVIGSLAAVGGVVINGSMLRVVTYADAGIITDSARHVLLIVAAFIALLVSGVCGLILYLHRRLARGEREHARRIEAKNEELTAANQQLEVLATIDALTGLPNRSVLHERLNSSLLAIRPRPAAVALLLLDLNRFKEINDTLGHHYGDLMLHEIGARMRALIRPPNTIARLGGDEFGVLLCETTADEAGETARRLLAVLETPVLVEGQSLDVDASIGIALAPDHGTDSVTLLRCADVAMYVAKRMHGGATVYAPDLDQHSLRRLGLMTELRQAIARDALVLHYQPMVTLATGTVRGVEALIRWAHPEYGLIPPDYFIPLAEHTGLIAPLTEWVLDTALRQCRHWQRSDLPLDISVNLSMRTLHDHAFPAIMEQLLRHYAVAPDRLTLEITESALMADPVRALEVVTRLGASGVRVAIDDFGTGYSSLGYLKGLPVDRIKLDKSFILGLGTDLRDTAIVESVIAMARALHREVVAEGVERLIGLEVLQALGCDVAQGHYLGNPMPAADLEHWMARSPWGLRHATAEPGR